MRSLVKLCTLILFVAALGASASSAETFNVMTEEFPPFNYTEDGKLTGLSSEVVAEIMSRIGHPNSIKVLPWSRAYNLIQKQDKQVLFSMTRTEQREPLFKWVGPLAPNKWVFFAKKGSGIKINSLEDAKKVKSIGTYKDDAAELFLKEKQFTNIDSVINDYQNVLKLMAGRIDLWIVGELQGLHKAKSKNVEPSKLEKVFEVKDTQVYIAFSKGTADNEIAKWQKALDDLKADGTYDKIMSKYLN